MATNSLTYIANLENLLYNPAAIQGFQIDRVREIDNGTVSGEGVDIVDATNPMVMLMECSAVNTAAFINRDRRSTRRTYVKTAQTVEELYLHMSDKDYVDRFAVPSKAQFLFFINEDELLNKMVLDPDTGIRKLVIPRNSYVTIADTVFSLEYPVEIRVLNHGAMSIVYNVEVPSPTLTLSSNLITWTPVQTDVNTTMVGFQIEMSQFKIVEHTVPVNASRAIVETIGLSDDFYYCRVFQDNGNGNYVELRTTHTDSVYDIDVPTAILKVTDGELTVKIPQIYVDTNMISRTLRIFVYETKGAIDIPLRTYSSDAIVRSFYSIFPNEIDEFAAPLSGFNQWITQAATNTIGGAAAMTKDQLGERVKNNAVGEPVLPITPAQISAALTRTNYELVKNIDNIVNRTYLATRSMPEPVDSDLITAAAAGIGTLPTKLTTIVDIDTVIDNGSLVTILPGTLYKIESGILSIVSRAEQDMLNALSSDQRALAISRRNYFYTPFYYVLDTNNDQFEVRAYHLDSPEIKERSFVQENDTTGFQVSIGAVSTERTVYGYRVLVQTKSSDNWKALDDEDAVIQMAITPNGGTERAYVNGTLVGRTTDNERIYEIRVNINSAINSDDRLTVTNFAMYGDEARDFSMDLDTKVDILFVTTAPPQSNYVQSTIDDVLGYYLLDEGAYGLTHESFRLVTGVPLEYLWTRARSSISEQDYLHYDADVPATYDEDVYWADPVTGSTIQIVNGEVVRTKLFSKGDPILQPDGEPVIKYRKGEIKTDDYGNGIIANQREVLRLIDLLLIEGVYQFATDSTAQTYKQQITDDLVEWVTLELPAMGTNLLENTELFLYPISSVGNINIIYGASLQTTIDASQTLQVRYHVRADVYKNGALRTAIEKKTIRIIGDALKLAKVAVSDIVEQLKEACGDDVLSIVLSGLGGDRNFDMLTVVDNARRLSIKKRLVNRSDEVLYLQEAIDIEFVRHTTT